MNRLGRAQGIGKLYLARRGDGAAQWTLDWTDSNGRRHRKALSSDRRTALRMQSELIASRDLARAGVHSDLGQARLLADLVEPYVSDLAHRACAKQVVNVRARLTRILASLPARRVQDLRVIDVLEFRSARVRAGASHRTANTDVGALRAMLRWSVSAGLVAADPLQGVKPLSCSERYRKHIRRALSDVEIEQFLQAAHDDDADQAAHCAAETTIAHGTKAAEYAERRRLPRVPQAILFQVLVECGSRWNETVQTTWDDLDSERLTLRLRGATTKSGKSRTIPMRAELVDQLLGLRTIHQRVRQRVVQPTDHIFLSPSGDDARRDTNNVRRVLYRVLNRAGIARKTADGLIDLHSLRHTAASRMARHGVPLVIAARVLGHASTEMTARVYSHLSTEDLRGALIESGPKRVRTA